MIFSCEPSLRELIKDGNHKWIFVGGKGGVGKTSVSVSIAVKLAKFHPKEKILLISLDPAHNLCDALMQVIGPNPVPIRDIKNLWAVELDPSISRSNNHLTSNDTHSLTAIINRVVSKFPGVDEAMGFAELMKFVLESEVIYSRIVFDTAPTGHTMRFLSFPFLLEEGLGAVLGGNNSCIGNLIEMATSMFQFDGGDLIGKFRELRNNAEKIKQVFKNPAICTFVCVCIPEFLSVYETERLIQTLAEHCIDCAYVVVNQVNLPPSYETAQDCQLCTSRRRMQRKYLIQLNHLYGEDFHVVCVPLLNEEVRGLENAEKFGQLLTDGRTLPL